MSEDSAKSHNQALVDAKRQNRNYDVFLCHNSADKPRVKKIAERLIGEYGLLPWLDERELISGEDWLDEIEKQIKVIPCAAVFLGESPMGRWAKMEMKAFLMFADMGKPLIPVNLSKSAAQIPFPLQGLMLVDFRWTDPDPMKQLVDGIKMAQKKVAVALPDGLSDYGVTPATPAMSLPANSAYREHDAAATRLETIKLFSRQDSQIIEDNMPTESKAVIFTHWGELKHSENLAEFRGKYYGLLTKYSKIIKPYLKCEKIAIVYVYVDWAVKCLFSPPKEMGEPEPISLNGFLDVLGKENALIGLVAHAVRLAKRQLSIEETARVGPIFHPVGLRELTELIVYLNAVNPKLIGRICGPDGNFGYDSPKFVESVIRLARGSRPGLADHPIIRIDEDANVSEPAIDLLLNEYRRVVQDEVNVYYLFSGAYGGGGPINDHAGRVHWLGDAVLVGSPNNIGSDRDPIAMLPGDDKRAIEQIGTRWFEGRFDEVKARIAVELFSNELKDLLRIAGEPTPSTVEEITRLIKAEPLSPDIRERNENIERWLKKLETLRANISEEIRSMYLAHMAYIAQNEFPGGPAKVKELFAAPLFSIDPDIATAIISAQPFPNHLGQSRQKITSWLEDIRVLKQDIANGLYINDRMEIKSRIEYRQKKKVKDGEKREDIGSEWAKYYRLEPNESIITTFLADLSELGATQISHARFHYSRAMKQKLTGRRARPPRHPQVVSGAGLILSVQAIRLLPPFMNFNTFTSWVDDHIKRLLHEMLTDIAPDEVECVTSATFTQDRNPGGVKAKDVQWAEDQYFVRLLRGCLLDSIIRSPNGDPTEYSKEVSRLARDSTADVDLSNVGKDALLEYAMARCKDVRDCWTSSEFKGYASHLWAAERMSDDYMLKVCNEVLIDAFNYLDLVHEWATFANAVTHLNIPANYWLYQPVGSI